MAWAYHVFLVDPELPFVPVEHIFYGMTKAECKDRFNAHRGACSSFGPAVAEGRFDDKWKQIDEDDLPRAEESGDDRDAIEMEEEK